MTVPAGLAALAFALESAYGTLAAPVIGLPYSSFGPVDNNGLLFDASWRGSAVDVAGHETGVLDSAISVAGPVLPDSIGIPLAGMLGDVVFAAGSPNTHTMSVLNTGGQQPPSYTGSLSDPAGLLQWAGCKVASLKLAWDASALLKHETALVGLASSVPGALVMPAVTTEKPLPSWTGALLLGGSAETRLLSGSISLERVVTAKRNSTGAQAPWLQRSEELKVSGALEVAVLTDTYRALLLGGTTTSLDLTFSTGVGAALRSLKLHCSQAVLSAAARNYGGRWVEIGATFRAEGNTTDAGASGGRSPLKVTLKNAIGSGVYA